MNDLISEIPPITDPLDFCTCLGVPITRCQEIHTDHRGSIKSLVKKIAAVWYKQSPERNWDEVVAALFCHEDNRAAVQL